MSCILHISDTHFGTEQAPVVDAVLKLAHDLRPELVVLSGDVTQRARRGQFAGARAFLSRLGLPTLVIPGNHDIPLFNVAARLFSPYGGYRRAMGDELEPVFSNERVLAIGVNTTRPSRHKNGEVSRGQIERVCARLRQARPDQLRMVVVHQPVRAIVESDMGNLLIGRDAAVAAWVDAGMDVVLGGHIHLPYVMPLQTGSARRAWAVQAGTAVSSRLRGAIPNSVNVIEPQLQEGGSANCRVQRWDYDASGKAFATVGNTVLELSR
ncbi:3',5'-cyclic AMP phosphodiesterase CpdA [Cupriavidus gilardii J11]|uniref:3',5'-cyclic AMP phosphodiesterase CpdA n=1 Tax=Cupriavidus gilardii J11 TaxID=936133 RepID=A0A562BDV2_9BURK|nr:metallophosphoesterase [Cupriavidus gilardii]TWG83367.1 3',5'-cyclic AMP phosphodiesterase CpdA [Cupriavidus gilardii J11]